MKESLGMIVEMVKVLIKVKSIGLMLYKNGEKYEGQWVDDKKGPEGTYFYSDGSIYKGDIINEMKEGSGTFSS
jgi:hypothetical protein